VAEAVADVVGVAEEVALGLAPSESVGEGDAVGEALSVAVGVPEGLAPPERLAVGDAVGDAAEEGVQEAALAALPAGQEEGQPQLPLLPSHLLLSREPSGGSQASPWASSCCLSSWRPWAAVRHRKPVSL
jgi:hypothetical protein